jgi:uncharacterized protein YigA (DUF484 family)
MGVRQISYFPAFPYLDHRDMVSRDNLTEIKTELGTRKTAHAELVETVSRNDGILRRIVELGLSILQRPSISDPVNFLMRDFARRYNVDRAALRPIESHRRDRAPAPDPGVIASKLPWNTCASRPLRSLIAND